ncbi:MAG: alpha/beta fold hydrolase [Pseudomonadota bacterium]
MTRRNLLNLMGFGALALGLITDSAAAPCPADWTPAFPVDPVRYPFTHQCITLGQGTVHYFDEQTNADPIATVLMLHGNPTWSYLYRDIAQGLRDAGYRVIAPDLYGFGLSDKPSLANFGYRPRDHASTVAAFVEALDLRDLILVVQDWGAPVGISAAANAPDRYGAFLIMNTFLQPMSFANPGVNHLGVDFSTDNIVNEDEWRTTGRMPRDVGISLGSLYGEVGSEDFIAVRDAYWGPFLDPQTELPLSPDIVAPTNIFAQNLLLSAPLLARSRATMRTQFSDRPLYLLWGHDDRMWGALRCDVDVDPACPAESTCRFRDGARFCIGADDDFIYPQIDNVREAWGGANIVGETISRDGIHFVQEVEQEAIIEAVQALQAAMTQRRTEP